MGPTEFIQGRTTHPAPLDAPEGRATPKNDGKENPQVLLSQK